MTINLVKGDIIVFKAADNNYKTLICTSVFRERSPHFFQFACLTFDKPHKPNIEELTNEYFFGNGIRKDDGNSYTIAEKEKMWEVYPEIKPYCLGSYGFLISRKVIKTHLEKFELIGNLNIVDNLDRNGKGINANDWNFLNEFFTNDYESKMHFWGQTKFSLKSIIRPPLPQV